MTAALPAGTGEADAGTVAGREAGRRLRSVRERARRLAIPAVRRVRRTSPPVLGLVVLVAVVEVLHGFRALSASWAGGDLLYHQALAHEILRGTFPLEGPYAGLPTYYPPLFHLLLAGTMGPTGLDAVGANGLLNALWLPVLPVGTFLLARRITGRPWVALLAAVLTVFAGAYDLRPGRLWVNALFTSGHSMWPLYPRDLVFGLIPFGVLAFLRALEARPARAAAWAAGAGLVFGAAALAQVQLLLPLPVALIVAAAIHEIRSDGRAPAIALAVVVTGVVALVCVAPWLAGQVAAIQLNAGVALDSSEALEPARFGLWSYPRQFGLVLPLAFLGSGVALLFLRRADGPRPAGLLRGRWRPSPVAGGTLLVTWAALAFGLGVLYSPDWPLEDALRPQRMWLLASQPMAILAAIGLAAVAEEVLEGRLGRHRLVVPSVVLATAVSCIPATAATVLLIADTWTRPTYAHLDLARDRVPDLAALVGGPGSRETILAPEDWSSLVWYATGHAVVGLEPAGYAKLAFDPARFTPLGQEQRRRALLDAYSGDVADLAHAAGVAGARRIVIPRAEDGRWGLFDASTGPAAARPGAAQGDVRPVAGNGWDGVLLGSGGALTMPAALPAGAVRLEIRVVHRPTDPPAGRLRVVATTATGEVRSAVIDAAGTDFTVLAVELALPSGATSLRLEGLEPVVVQSVRGFVAPPAASGLPDGWRILAEAPDAVVLGREG